MKPLHWILITFVLAGVLIYIVYQNMHAGQQSTMAVQCGNETRYIYKDPEQAFPMVTSDYETNFQVASGLLNKLAGDTGTTSISLDTKNTARALVDTLSQENIFYETTLKAYFIESNNSPCDDNLRNRYLAFVAQMADNMMGLKGFITQVTSPATEAGASEAGGATSSEAEKSAAKKVLAVVDTTKGKVSVDTSEEIAKVVAAPEKMVMMRNATQLHSAVSLLAAKYRIHL